MALARTPLLVRLPVAHAPWSLVLRREGFAEARRELQRGERMIDVALVAEAPLALPIHEAPPTAPIPAPPISPTPSAGPRR